MAPLTSDPSPIGQRVPMIDSVDKVTGAGKYADDLDLPGMLVGKVLHSPHPHARIRFLDTSAAERLAGVHAVVAGRETPIKYGILPVGHDETIFAADKVRYVGDNVAGVAAESEAVAEEALRLIKVDYEVLRAYFDPEQSMRAETDLIHADRAHNIEKEYHHHFGNVEEGFARADYIREDRFDCAEVTHAALEPHSTLARFEPDGSLTVWSSTQVPYYLMKTLASTLQMPEEKVRVIKPLVGGGFGGKSEVIPLELATAVLAIEPVELRRRNLLEPPCMTVNGLRVLSYGYPECIDKVVERSGWKQKYGKLPYGKGIGIAGSHYVSGAANPIIRSKMPHTTINLSIDRAGTVTVFTGAAEIGQGSDTVQAQIVAAELGVELDRVKIGAEDTALTPVDLGSYSSRVTFMAGNAALEAARQAKRQILSAAAQKLATTPDNLVIEDGKIFSC